MINYSAFHDELVKIAEEDDRNITKEKLKRLLPVAAASAIGVGLGTGAGKATERWILKPGQLKRLGKFGKHLPLIAGATGGAAGLAHGIWRSKANKYIRDGK